MTQMPQLVALFNGVGGGAAALVAVLELATARIPWVRLAVVFTMLVGAVSFAGSAVTVGKLQELISTRPLLFPGMPWVMAAVLLGAVSSGVDGYPQGLRAGRWPCWCWGSRPACSWCCPWAGPTCRS